MKTDVINYLKLFLPVISTLIIFNNCSTTDAVTVKSIEFKFLSGSYGGISIESHQLTSDKNEFDQFFSELNKNISPAMSVTYSPEKSYIFITFGEKSSGGLDYKVTKVTDSKNKIQVFLESTHKDIKPGEAITTMAIASPYIIIEINKTKNKEVELIKG